MNSKEAFSKVYRAVSIKANYIHRNYSSMGGIWTTDTWKKGDITTRLGDDGWTKMILVEKRLLVYEDGNGEITFYKGTEEDLVKLAETIG